MIVLGIAAANPGADAANFRSRDAGAYVSEGAPIDADRDGKMADLVLVSGSGEQLGGTTTQGVLEWPRMLTWTICPNGNLGFQGRLVKGNAIMHAENGDALLIRFQVGTICTDFVTNTASVELDGAVVGGTGEFANVTGSVRSNGIMVGEPTPDHTGMVLLGGVDFQTSGTISAKNREREDNTRK
jgi:hypothetical protein